MSLEYPEPEPTSPQALSQFDDCDLVIQDASDAPDDELLNCPELAQAIAEHVGAPPRLRPRRPSGATTAVGLSILLHAAMLAVASAVADVPSSNRPMTIMTAGNLEAVSESTPDGTDVRDSAQIATEAIQPLEQIQLPAADETTVAQKLELPSVPLESPREQESLLHPARVELPTPDAVQQSESRMLAGAPVEAPAAWMPPRSAPTLAASMPSDATSTPQRTEAAATGIRRPPRIVAAPGRRGTRDGLDGRGLPIPEYPAESRKRREQGLVELDVEVLPDGAIGEIRVVVDPGFPLLVQAAITAVKSAKFDPGTLDEKPTSGRLLIPFRFTLN